MREACKDLVDESLTPDANGIIHDPQETADHMLDNGWYSAAVMGRALRRTNAYTLLLGLQMQNDPDSIFDPQAAGAVVNQDDVHWVSLKVHDGQVWLLDSEKERPMPLTYREYKDYIARLASDV